MKIIFQIGDALYDALPKDIAHKYFVDARQKTNDVAIDFAWKLIAAEKLKMLENLKQYNGAYISIDGKRVNNMIHHDVIDAEIARLRKGVE